MVIRFVVVVFAVPRHPVTRHKTDYAIVCVCGPIISSVSYFINWQRLRFIGTHGPVSQQQQQQEQKQNQPVGTARIINGI